MSRMPSRIVITTALGLATLSWAAGPPASLFHAVDQAFASTQGGPGCDQGSLKNAIAAVGPGGTVQFTQDCPSSAPLNLSNSLVLSQDVTIDGNGHTVTITGIDSPLGVNKGVHVTLNDLTFANRGISFDASLNPIDNNGTMTISNSTFSNNFVPGEHDSGGAIANSGTMTITNSTFSDNHAAMSSTLTGGGGAVSNGGTMTINNSTFAGNQTGDNGGAITNGGTLTVSNTTFSNNSAAASGGAIQSSGTLTVATSTFSGNSATGLGGGAISSSFSGSGPITVTNSTFSGNLGAQGGALNVSSGDVKVTNSTFVNNSAVGIGGLPPAGGAIVNTSATVTIENNIFSGSTSLACNGHMTNVGGNLDDDPSCTETATSSLGTLGAPANNGGPTQTIALQSGSAAIGHAHSGCPTTDQRGAPRPHAGDATPRCDAGAYELGATVPPQSLVLSGVPADFTIDATSASGAIVSYTPPTASVWGNLTISCDNPSGTLFPIGNTTVTCAATDDFTNPKTVSAHFTVTVVDRTLSLAGMPKSIIDTAHTLTGQVETYALPTAVNLEGQTVAAATVSCDPVSGSLFPFGATTVTCTATDGAYANSPVSDTFFVSISAPGPVITDISPKTGTAEIAASTLTVSGTGFTEYTEVYLRPADTGRAAQLVTHVASTSQLTADLPANLKAEAAFITIRNTRFGGEASDHVLWPITNTGVATAGTPSFATGLNPSATTGSVTVSGTSSLTSNGVPGPGTLGVYSFASNPAGPQPDTGWPVSSSSGAYFAAFALPRAQIADQGIADAACFASSCIPSLVNPHAFTTVTIVDCALGGGQRVQWWNGTAWAPASDQTYNATTGCVTVTVGGTSRQPTQPSLDQLAGTPFGVTVTAPSVTVPSAQSVQYGAALSFTISATSAVAGRQLTLRASGLPAGLTFKDNGDGTGTVSGTDTASVGASPYTATFIANDGLNDSPAGTVDISVTPAPLTLTADDQRMTYGGPAPIFTAGSSDFVNGDTAASLTGLTCTSSPTGHVGSHPITCSGSTDPDYAVTYKNGTLTINPAPLTITADNQQMAYGGTMPALTHSYNGLVNGDTSSTAGLAENCSTTATAGSHAAPYPITCSGATDADYFITNKNGTLTIAQVVLTITASSPSMIYGGTTPAITPSYSGFTNGDGTASLTTGPSCGTVATSSSHAGQYDTTCSGAVDPDYAVQYAKGQLTIKPAPLTITADKKSMTYGVTQPALTWTANFVNGDTAASLTTAPTCGTAAATSPAGNYDITCSGAADPNYTIGYARGTLSINPALLTITADDQGMTYGGTRPALTWTANFVNGDAAASLTTAPSCRTVAATSPAGSYDIICSGAVDSNYTISYAKGTLKVAARAISVTASSPTGQTYGSTAVPAITCTATGFLGTDTFTTAPDGAVYDATGTTKVSITSTSDAGTYVTKCSGGDPGGNYAIGGFTPGSFTINAAPLTITANNQSYTYGDQFSLSPSVTKSDPKQSTLAGTLSCHAYALLDVGDATPLAVGGALLNAGTYTIQCSGLSSSNYHITWTPGMLTVNQKVAHVTASSGTLSYGAAAPAGFTTNFSSGDFAGSDTSSVVSGSLNCTSTYAAGADAGSYPITCTSSLSALNYTFVSGYDGAGSTLGTALPSATPAIRLGTLTINPASLTITANDQSYTYGDAFTLSQSVTRSDSGQSTLSGTLSCSAYATTDTTHATPLTVGGTSRTAGSYAIQCTGLSNRNYGITWTPGALTVKQKAITVTASSPSSQTYGHTAAPTVTCGATGFLGRDNFSTVPEGAVYDAAGTATVTITSTSDAGTYPTKCAGGDPGGNYTISGYTPGSFAINPVATTVQYTGTQLWRLGESGQPWTMSAAVTPIECAGSTNGSVIYTLDHSPLTQALGAYQLVSSSPPTSGPNGWHEGAYVLTATYTPSNHNCSPSSDSASLTIGGLGDVAIGAGSTVAGSVGQITFAFTVRSVPHTSSLNPAGRPSSAKGELLMTNTGKWSLKGTLTSYTRTAANQGAAGGTGDLSSWSPATHTWKLVRTGVSFTISFTGNRPGVKLYGQHISWSDPTIPNFTPVAIKKGTISVR